MLSITCFYFEVCLSELHPLVTLSSILLLLCHYVPVSSSVSPWLTTFLPSLSLAFPLSVSLSFSLTLFNNRNLTHLKTCLHSIWLYFSHKKRARLSNQQENFFEPTRMENGFFSHRWWCYALQGFHFNFLGAKLLYRWLASHVRPSVSLSQLCSVCVSWKLLIPADETISQVIKRENRKDGVREGISYRDSPHLSLLLYVILKCKKIMIKLTRVRVPH